MCPKCKAPLANSETLECRSCKTSYAVDDGVPVFTPEQTIYRDYDSFWCDERPFEHLTRGRHFFYSAFRYWSYRERRYFEKHIRRGSVLLDMGCWAGNRAYADFGIVTGIDLCLEAVKKASQVYDFAVQGTVTDLPFANDSFDCVLSSHVLGHLSREEKDKAVSEMFRVLKPGGLCLHIIETDSGGALVTRAKLQPELYQKYFIDRYGHVGLEKASVVVARFKKQGFKVEDIVKMDSLAPPPWYYQQYFENEYAQVDPLLRRRLRVSNWLCSTRVSRFALGFLCGILHCTWEQWFGRLDNSMHLSICLKKPVSIFSRELSFSGPNGGKLQAESDG